MNLNSLGPTISVYILPSCLDTKTKQMIQKNSFPPINVHKKLCPPGWYENTEYKSNQTTHTHTTTRIIHNDLSGIGELKY